MLHRQIIFIVLLFIFTSSFAQHLYANSGNKLIYRHQREASASQSDTKQSNQNGTSSVNSNDNQPAISNQLQSIPLASSTLLASSTECKGDIQKYCMKNSGKLINNLKALQCIDDLDNAVNLISKECQNKIYRFKYNMTHDVHFDDTAMKVCKKDIKLLEDCSDHTDERGSGRLVSCLYDLFDNLTEPSCRYFIEQIQATVFTDWRLSERFATACLADITQLKCGRLDEDNETLPHEQGAVISCLSKSHTKLTKDCLKHISRLAEMQSDDYHLDRALYYACREDRERFCSQVASGNGRVYRCLYDQKFNNLMSSACREEVHRRQELVAANALVDAPFIRACKNEMREHQCVENPKDPDKQLSLVNLLLCLEKRIKSGNTINDDCRRQMLIHRRMLMSDYAVVPEIISECKTEMTQHCPSLYQKGASGTIDQRGGRMIHCLLGAARKEKQTFSQECLSTIKSFVRAVDPGSDIRADPLLETTCRPVIDALCSKIKPGDSNVIMCLLDNLKNSRMTEDCEDRLMEVAYFMLRDWRLTPKLLGTCRKDLLNLCQFPSNWTMSKDMTDVRIGKYLSCLNRQKNQLNSDCRSELKRLMRIRSQSVNLMPEIEDNCLIDLATCKNPEVKGEELKCLQKKYDKLEKDCKKAVKKYTEPEVKDPTLNFPLMKSCEPMIQLFCSNVDNSHENDQLIRCLIKQKNNQKMDYRCKANLEHHQLISLKDAAFLSEQFQTKCKQELNEHCQGKKTKSGVIQCLARLMLQDILKKTNQLKEDCRDELKFELLQRSESINFDPALAKACQNDIHKFCANQNPGNAQVLDCLKANRNKVSNTCFRKLQQREQTDIVQPDNDYSLTTNCAPVIQKFCANENKHNILSCLRRNANRDVTTSTCRNVLYHRLMVLNSDARFNKALIDNCQNDIAKYCQGEVMDDDDDNDDDDDDVNTDNNEENNNDDGEVKDRDMGGRIIGCLRMKYANKNADLESKCISELANVIHDSKLDVQLDVKLYQNCKEILDTKCPGVEKEDCLKLLYQSKQLEHPGCKEQVIRIIKEGQADIHIDQVLAIACQTDLLRYCNDIPIGGGKQLQCLIRLRETVTNTCRNVLSKRQELWSSISDIDDIDDLTRHIVHSSNNFYLYSIILLLLCLIFFTGCICRPYIRFRRISKYQ